MSLECILFKDGKAIDWYDPVEWARSGGENLIIKMADTGWEHNILLSTFDMYQIREMRIVEAVYE